MTSGQSVPVDTAWGRAYLRPLRMPWSAPVAELADAHGSGPCSERSGGSTPLGRTRLGRRMALKRVQRPSSE